MSIRLMVADGHPAIRAGVAAIIQGTEVDLICQARNCDEALNFALTCDLDVLLLDRYLPDRDGLSVLEAIARAQPTLSVLVFSVSDEMKEMAYARRMAQEDSSPRLFPAMNCCRIFATRQLASRFGLRRQLQKIASRAAQEALAVGDIDPLSPREKEVLGLIKAGKSNEDIGKALGIGIDTVKQHVKFVLRKLHLADRTQAALWAIRQKAPLLSIGERVHVPTYLGRPLPSWHTKAHALLSGRAG